ncbi:MotA/TolQ/ExbB proton channel family protein [Flavobacterium facile]|jgi:biopolymer transport protein ExbB|uniref:MotA/TolQ/ExbB proton channel family protein n=1 Tax=Flavobacterium facile TaxID=2893174 RepID=UPI002E786C4A|nr:MotA/TolQ/ExbB proton channel family protein [Flavobacterium sp. T-12]
MEQDLNVSVENKGSKGSSTFAAITIVICIVIGALLWKFVMGAPANFVKNDPAGQPLPGNYLGMVYKGGVIVPVLMGLFLMTIVFSVERFIVLKKAAGNGNLDNFVKGVLSQIKSGDVQGAISACDTQEGSVANVIKAGLLKSEQVKKDGLDVDAATENITKEVEQATSLEMPMLEKHLTIISTLVSIGTLLGLLGTVSGMIKAFAGLAEGTPDQAELANGISEALINTATGIGTSTMAVIAYNYFTSKIDTLTYFIDEAGFAISQAYKRAKGGN